MRIKGLILITLLLVAFTLFNKQEKMVGGILQVSNLTSSEVELSDSLVLQQDNCLKNTGKYCIIERGTDKNSGEEYWVDHIVVWDGKETPKSDGYQINIKKNGQIKSFGIGDKSQELSKDWETEVVPQVITEEMLMSSTTLDVL
jgi:hypothetical protein